ncbi:hypothetical protein BMF94_0950 [Rhodotorula taiwanensis]|uniref:Uncharacterized protein n=1 Tax=Rhodotorula taiwanensis TaxID=741276 RepID=A0A2S5BGG7_9BASI|nr:hypothetical protein BMF94_0950 [Rhodotorula taiwanensis]
MEPDPIASTSQAPQGAPTAALPVAAAAPVPLGRRAKLTQDALFAASNKVIKVLDDKAMRQCFPRTWNEQYPDLIPGLKALVVATYTEGVPLAWNDLAQSADFIAKANELDRLLEDAKARKARGEAPRNAYEIGLDATVTTPSATAPRLRSAIEELREKRRALSEQNAATYERIASLSQTATSLERQNDEILTHFTQSVAALKEIDEESLVALQDELVKVVGPALANAI